MVPVNTLRDTATELESVFINQALAAMRRAVGSGGFMKAGSAEKTFQGMFDEEMARQIAKQGGLGLADTLCSQLSGEKR